MELAKGKFYKSGKEEKFVRIDGFNLEEGYPIGVSVHAHFEYLNICPLTSLRRFFNEEGIQEISAEEFYDFVNKTQRIYKDILKEIQK